MLKDLDLKLLKSLGLAVRFCNALNVYIWIITKTLFEQCPQGLRLIACMIHHKITINDKRCPSIRSLCCQHGVYESIRRDRISDKLGDVFARK